MRKDILSGWPFRVFRAFRGSKSFPFPALPLNAKCPIERNRLFFVYESKVLFGELDGISGAIGLHIHAKTLGAGVVGGFYFDGDELSVALYDEINLRAALAFPIIGPVAVDRALTF